MKRQQITAFYLETLLLIGGLIAVILVLTHVFAMGRAESARARLLTNAVTLAANAAETVSAADSEEALLALLDDGGNASLLPGGGVEARYDPDMTADAAGTLRLAATWEPQGETDLVRSTVSVYAAGEEEPVYTLETAVYLGEVGR